MQQKPNYNAKIFYEQKQEEHKKKFGVYFDTNSKIGEIIQEYCDQEIAKIQSIYIVEFYDGLVESFFNLSAHLTTESAEEFIKTHQKEQLIEWTRKFSKKTFDKSGMKYRIAKMNIQK